MNIIITDDEQYALMDIEAAVREVLPNSRVSCFNTPAAALDFALKNFADIAFLDIEMGGMNGLKLAEQLLNIYDKTNIIFVTGYSHYALDAFDIYASGYLLKPVAKEAVLKCVKHLRHPVVDTSKFFVQCFGNFEVFSNGKPLRFPRRKSKEIFAYLIHKNGASCTMRELAAVLFEDNTEINIRPYIAVMKKTLEGFSRF